MYYLGSTPLRLNSSFEISGTVYPSNWLTVSTEADKTAIGIRWVNDPVRADDRFYWNGNTDTPKALEDVDAVDNEGNPIYVQVWNEDTEQMEDTTERLVTRGLKYTWILQVKDTAGKMLAQTDWMVTRKFERDIDIPADVVTKRAAIVTECTRLETAITAADMDAFIAVVQDQRWPE
ncbi:MAG: hypothetical protein CMI60_22530 [Parvibaculum sp.]|nr:hypothetical protein [Parvibaculum sp.]